MLATLHTTDAVQTIDRIIDVFPPHQQQQIRTQISITLQAVVSQQLVMRSDESGRVPCVEIMIVNSAIRNLIRENKSYRIDSSIQTGKKLGMQLLDEHLWRLYDEGKITIEEMLDKARQPGALQDKAADRHKRLNKGKEIKTKTILRT